MTQARRDYAGGAVATTITAGINSSDLSISIAAATGWPSGSNGKFYVVIDRGLSSEEKILCSSRSGTTLTVSSTADRGVDGTTAQIHASGAAIEHCGTATDLDDTNDHIYTTSRDDHTQYLNTTRHDITARHAFGAALGTPGVATTLTPGDAAAAGTGSAPAREDHAHALSGTIGKGVVYRSADLTAGSAAGDVTGMTAIALTGDGTRRFRITVHMPYITNSTTGTTATVTLMEGATTIATLAIVTGPTSWQLHTSYDLVPSAAAHTYKINIGQSGGTVALGGGTNVKSYVMAEDIGT